MLFPNMVIDSIEMIEKGNKGKKQDEKMHGTGIKEMMMMDI